MIGGTNPLICEGGLLTRPCPPLSPQYHTLQAHTADQDRPFRCDQCPKGFARRDRLRQHVILAHTKTRPHACRYEGCGMTYASYGARYCHERDRHGASKGPSKRKDPKPGKEKAAKPAAAVAQVAVAPTTVHVQQPIELQQVVAGQTQVIPVTEYVQMQI